MKRLSFIFASFLLATACNSSLPPASGTSSSAPTANTEDTVSGPKVTLTWSAGTGAPTGYNVAESTDGTTYKIVKAVPTTTATISVSSGTTYYFKVQATNGGGVSAYTSPVTVSVP